MPFTVPSLDMEFQSQRSDRNIVHPFVFLGSNFTGRRVSLLYSENGGADVSETSVLL
jgi:hypothetical protein